MRTRELLKILTIGIIFLSFSANAQAQKDKKTNQTTQQVAPINYCQQAGEVSEDKDGVKVSQLYISEANGAVWETCLQVGGAKLSLKENGQLVLLERGINTKVEYYTTGSRSGRVKTINDVTIDYYTSGYYKKGKPRRVGNITVDYYSSGFAAGKLKQIGNIAMEYYNQGGEKGRLKRINGVIFTYLVNRLITPDGKEKELFQMQTSGSLEGIPMMII